ncbi:hypothetical protein [Salana multivorans]
MSRIHNNWVPVGFRSCAMLGAATNKIVNIMNSSVDGVTSTASPHHCFAPARGAGVLTPLMTHPL